MKRLIPPLRHLLTPPPRLRAARPRPDCVFIGGCDRCGRVAAVAATAADCCGGAGSAVGSSDAVTF